MSRGRRPKSHVQISHTCISVYLMSYHWPNDHLRYLLQSSQLCEVLYRPAHEFRASKSPSHHKSKPIHIPFPGITCTHSRTGSWRGHAEEAWGKQLTEGAWVALSNRWTLTDSLRTSDMGERHSWNTNSWFVFSKSMIKGKLETTVKISSDSQASRHVAGCCMTLGSDSGLWPGFN